MASKKYDIPKVFDKYKSSVNMNLQELKDWKKNPCSKKASIGRTAIDRNIRLLSTPKEGWSNSDAREANKTISFNARMSGMPHGRHIKGCDMSKRDISLKNWALDPHKKRSDNNALLKKDASSKDFSKYPYTYEVFTIGDMLKGKRKGNDILDRILGEKEKEDDGR